MTANPGSLTFTTLNWDTAQTVTVTAANDADLTNATVSLTHSAASSDADYQGITIAGVTVTVTDNDGSPRPVIGGGGGGGGGAPANRAPEFTEGRPDNPLDSREPRPPRRTSAIPSPPPTARDDTLTYSLHGVDAVSFDIDPATGQLLTKAPLDYETQASYSVIVSVSDGKSSSGRESDTRDASITVPSP